MAIEIDVLECNLFGDFKIGDNTGYNSDLMCDLVEANEDGKFNKPIVLQAAALIEVAAIQIFYRAANYNCEGVPNISAEDQTEIAAKQIDKFAVVIDSLRKYGILRGMGADIYDELHKLRKYRNKVHIQGTVDIKGAPRDEVNLFTDDLVGWAINLNWSVLNYLQKNYPRPAHIDGYVKPLRLPKVV